MEKKFDGIMIAMNRAPAGMGDWEFIQNVLKAAAFQEKEDDEVIRMKGSCYDGNSEKSLGEFLVEKGEGTCVSIIFPGANKKLDTPSASKAHSDIRMLISGLKCKKWEKNLLRAIYRCKEEDVDEC